MLKQQQQNDKFYAADTLNTKTYQKNSIFSFRKAHIVHKNNAQLLNNRLRQKRKNLLIRYSRKNGKNI